MQKQKPGLLLWKVISTQLRGKVNQLMALISNLFMSSPPIVHEELCRDGALPSAQIAARGHAGVCSWMWPWDSNLLSLALMHPTVNRNTPFFWSKWAWGSILSTLSCLVHRTSAAEPVPGHISCNCTNFSYFPHSIAPLATWGISPSAAHFISLCLCSKQEFNISWSTVSVCNKVSRECDF